MYQYKMRLKMEISHFLVGLEALEAQLCSWQALMELQK